MNEENLGLGWFYRRWERTFNRVDKTRIAESARLLAEAYPGESREKLAGRVVGKSCRVSALAGAMSATPSLVPGIGTAISILSIVPEEVYLIEKQCEMLLRISALYGFDPADEERLFEIVTLIGATARNVEALMVAKYDLRRMAARATVHLGVEAGGKGLRGVFKRLPALGFLAGCGINYFTFRALGQKAILFYSTLSEQEPRPDPGKKVLEEKIPLR